DQRDPPRGGDDLPDPDRRPRLGHRAGGGRRRPRRDTAGGLRAHRHARADRSNRRPGGARGATRRPARHPARSVAPPLRAGDLVIRVLIAEDQAMLLGALAALLSLEPDLEVVGQAKDGREALDLARSARPDVVLADIEMPHLSGLELAVELARLDPSPRVVIVTTFARAGYLRRALEAGVAGYLLKDAPVERLAEAIRRAHQGLKVIDPELAAQAWTEADPLSDRERQVLRLAAEGWSAPRIARERGWL